MKFRSISIALILAIFFNIASICTAFSQENTQPPTKEKTEADEYVEYEEFGELEKKDPITILQETKPNLKKEIELVLEYNLVPITLEEALSIALEKNYDIKIITKRRDATKWDYYNSLTNFLPDIDYFFDYRKLDGEFIAGGVIPIEANERISSSTWGFDWEIFSGLRNFYTAKARKNILKAEKETLEFTLDETIIEVTTQYYRILQDKLNIEVLTRNLKQREAQLKLNTQRFEAGVGTKFDVLRAEAEVASADQNLTLAYNSFRLAQATLANTLGIQVFTPLFPVEDDVEKKQLINEDFKLEQLSDTAMAYRNDLKSARYDVKTARARRNLAYTQYLPTVSIIGIAEGVETNTIPRKQNNTIALLAEWKGGEGLGLEGITDGKAQKARLEEAKLEATILARNIKENLLSAYYDSITSRERVRAAQEEVESANESLRLSFLRLEAGIGIFVDVLQAQATAVQAKIRLINATADYNIAQARILFEAGVLVNLI